MFSFRPEKAARDDDVSHWFRKKQSTISVVLSGLELLGIISL
jgi:hypothetical protein